MENEQLVAQIKAGIDRDNNMLRLYLQMKGLIFTIARHYSGLAELEDLTQEGYLGLVSAVSHYEPKTGVKFSVYAGICMKRQIQRYLHSNNPLGISEQMQHLVFQYSQLCSAFLTQFDREPSDREAAHFLNLKDSQVKQIKKTAQMEQPASLDSQVAGEEDITLCDTVKAEEDTEREVVERLLQKQLGEDLWETVDGLPEHQPEIIRRRYQRNMTFQQIGDSMGIPRERARQLENKGIRSLRELRHMKRLAPYAEEFITIRAYHGGGVQTFSRTWTSSTERTALALADKHYQAEN